MGTFADEKWLQAVSSNLKSYRKMIDGVTDQLSETEFFARPRADLNSVAIVLRHLGGNLLSRWTDFLTTDGEKPDRNRDGEFTEWQGDKASLLAYFNSGWDTLTSALTQINQSNINAEILIRGEKHSVAEALMRALTHISYHVGQVVLIARMVHQGEWRWLTIRPGGSEQFNKETWGNQSSTKFEELVSSVRKAGELLLTMWPGSSLGNSRLHVQEKSDGTLVSQADLASNTILIEAITRLFPNDAILSEESPADPEKLARAKRTWIIDPLDGTSSFVHGRDDFSVLVGLAEAGVVTVGVMFFPVLAKLVVSQPGQGARVNGAKLSVSTNQELLPGRIYIRNFTCARPELACPMMDSGLALLKVASGELDGAIIRMTTHREWDLAAPAAVLSSAGGMVSDETGNPVRFGRGMVDFQYVIVSNGLIHKQLQDVIVDSPRS